MTFLNPEEVKRGNINSLVDVVRLFPNLVKNAELQAIDTEWRLLRNNSELNKLDNDIQVFWHQVTSMKLGNNEMAFPVLSRFVQNILCLPHSSANVERQFSAINLMKTKVRSKLETDQYVDYCIASNILLMMTKIVIHLILTTNLLKR
jgi:hypothetical protein